MKNIKVTYKQLYKSYPIFKELLDQSMPVQTTLKIRELVETLNPHLKQIESIQNELIEKYSEETKEEGVVEIPKKNRDKFIEELEKSLEVEIFVGWEPIKIDALGDKISISVKGLETISYLLEDYQNMAVL